MFVGVIRGFQDGVLLNLNRLHGPTDLNLTLFGGKRSDGGLGPELMSRSGGGHLGLAAGVRLFGSLDAQLSSTFGLEDDDEQSDLIGLLCGWRIAEHLRVDGDVEYDITRVKGMKNVLFSGEGLFLASLKGPGRVWLQTLPISNLAAKLAKYMPTKQG